MSLRYYPARFLLAITASSFLLFLSTVAVAVYLNSERARTADALGENNDSRRAADGLEETLTDLLALRERGVNDVNPLHERVEAHIREIRQFADKEAERELARSVETSFLKYIEFAIANKSIEAISQLKDDTLPCCWRLREFNSAEVIASEQAHQHALVALAWGFAVVGGLGSISGLVLGYGLARSLRRAVDSLLVQVRGASDLLGQELATVRIEKPDLPHPDGIDDLVVRVSEVVKTLQQREREVRRAERLAAVGQLAAGVAHEIRNPLTSIQLLIQTAIKDPLAGALDETDLSMIDSELARIELSLKGLLDYARPSKPERVITDFVGVVRNALNLVRARAELQRVQIQFDSPAPIVLLADPQQLRQVVVNLLLNALDSMPNTGSLEVVLTQYPEQIKLNVIDSGSGIAPAILPRLFEPFATDKETGLGLGLVVSKRIVEDHGGSIQGSNLPGGGAQFDVIIPSELRSDEWLTKPLDRR